MSSTPEDRRAAGMPTPAGAVTHDEAIAREKERFGGVKVGAAFFGWLTATGTAVLLTALLAAVGTAIGLSTGQGGQPDPSTAQTVGVVGGVLLVLVLFVAYLCGGYVAGRMARFSGVKQGIAVWVWALVIAVVLALVGLVAGSQFDLLANLNAFPRLPINEGALTAAGIIATVAVLVASLGGAILGGLLGVRYHRKIDRAGFER